MAITMPPGKSTDRIDFAKFREYLRQLAEAQLNQNYGRRVDASDIVQTTLLDAHRHREQLRGDDSAEIAGWLRSILANNITDAVREATRERRDVRREQPLERVTSGRPARTPHGLASEQSSPSQNLVRDEMCAQLAAAIAQLPDDQRDALVLHHLQGLALREVAARMLRSEPSVAGLLHRGMKQLRALLSRQVEGP
jgi:RNA polymerase sigma-70 factor (ECF subfamily)